MRAWLLAGTLTALIPLFLILWYVAKRGIGAWSTSFFTTDPTGSFLGDPGGIKSALLGTIEIVLLASAIAIPIGVGVAVYLVEYGKQTVFARAVRYFIDVLTGVPSIVFGLFVYIVLILSGTFGSFAASTNPLSAGVYTLSLFMNEKTDVVRVAAIPEPETYALMLGGLGIVGFIARRRRKV